MNLQLRATGASYIAPKSAKNPRDLIVTVLAKFPDAECQAQFAEFRKMMSSRDDEYQRAVDFYFFVNMRSYMVTNRSRPEPQPAAQRRARVREIKRKIISLSLDFIMPNGEVLRDCTGTECAKAGGWLAKLGKKVGNRKVGSVVADDDALRRILR